jgi:hypothetical protein
MAELFEPDRESLRMPVDRLTGIFLALAFSNARIPGGQSDVDTAELVDLFLHGALV